MTRVLIVLGCLSAAVLVYAQPVSVSHTLSADEQTALTAIVARANGACQPQPTCQTTVQAYGDARVRDLFATYVRDELARDTAETAERYRTATPAQREAMKSVLP